MIKISVVDDDALFGKNVTGLIEECAPELVRTAFFQSGRAFLAQGADTDILFLDISMPDMSGMELALALKEKRKRPVVVFLTGMPEYVYDAFEAEAAGYLLKPVEKDKLKQVLNRVVGRIHETEKEGSLLIKNGGLVHKVVPEDILYVENQGRKLVFHTKEGMFSCYGKMEEYEKRLPAYFFRCHRGYLISLKEVSSYDRISVVLSNGETVLMAKQRYEAFLQAVVDWLK